MRQVSKDKHKPLQWAGTSRMALLHCHVAEDMPLSRTTKWASTMEVRKESSSTMVKPQLESVSYQCKKSQLKSVSCQCKKSQLEPVSCQCKKSQLELVSCQCKKSSRQTSPARAETVINNRAVNTCNDLHWHAATIKKHENKFREGIQGIIGRIKP